MVVEVVNSVYKVHLDNQDIGFLRKSLMYLYSQIIDSSTSNIILDDEIVKIHSLINIIDQTKAKIFVIDRDRKKISGSLITKILTISYLLNEEENFLKNVLNGWVKNKFFVYFKLKVNRLQIIFTNEIIEKIFQQVSVDESVITLSYLDKSKKKNMPFAIYNKKFICWFDWRKRDTIHLDQSTELITNALAKFVVKQVLLQIVQYFDLSVDFEEKITKIFQNSL